MENAGEIITAIALVLIFGVPFILGHLENVRRMELLHRERLAAIEKGLPPPEIPSQFPAHFPVRPPPNPKAALLTGILMTSISLGCMLVLFLVLPYALHPFWVAPAPVAFAGVGIILYYYLRDEKFH